MRVSIITAVFNNSEHIKGAIESVLLQTYTNIEYIIVDGGSTDGTLDIVHTYNSKLAKVIKGPDKGMYDALNKGLKAATGDIVGVLHSDDIFESNTIIEQIVNAFTQYKCQFLYGTLQYVQKNDTSKIVRFWESKKFEKSMLHNGWMPAHPTVFIKRELIEKYHLYYNLKLKIAADYDWMIRALKQPDLITHYLPVVITKMRTGGTSNKSIKNIIRKSWEDYNIMRAHKIGGLYCLIMKNGQKLGQFFKKK